MKRILAMLLAVSLVAGLLPVTAAAEGSPPTPRAGETVALPEANATVSTLTGLRDAIAVANADAALEEAHRVYSDTNPYVIAVTASFNMSNVSAGLEITGHVQIIVPAGKSVTLTMLGNSTSIFSVAKGGSLTLGHGRLNGDNTVSPAAGGELILDGGAKLVKIDSDPQWKWTVDGDLRDYTDTDNNRHIFYILMDEDMNHWWYDNPSSGGGRAGEYSLVRNASGTVNLYDGVILENVCNNASSGRGLGVRNTGTPEAQATFNMYGGIIRRCAKRGSGSQNIAMGAVYVGGEEQVGSSTYENTEFLSVFNMYGGAITLNGNKGDSYADGGGVGIDRSQFNMYGGEISYNRTGTVYSGSGNTSNGGGIHAREGSQINMYGGAIHHNFSSAKGGGICLWNSSMNMHGGSIYSNLARDGGGICSSGGGYGHNSTEYSQLTMTGGSIYANEARTVKPYDAEAGYETGYGGGICVGTSDRPDGALLVLSGGDIRENKSEYGGGLAVFSGMVTNIKMSGNAAITNNSAAKAGGGLCLDNDDEIVRRGDYDKHTLLTMSGNARISTDNAIYFKDIAKGQIPVKVKKENSGDTEGLAGAGVVGRLDFSDSFWNGPVPEKMERAQTGLKLVLFEDCPVQDNKFSIESSTWYLRDDTPIESIGAGAGHHLVLTGLGSGKDYFYRNGTPIFDAVNDMEYYRLYEDLSDAVREAAWGDTIFVVGNSTITTPVVIDNKDIKLVAENTSSAGIDAGSSGGSFRLRRTESGYCADGFFLLYIPDPQPGEESYTVDRYAYVIRNDYTVTLSKYLYLGDTSVADSRDPRPQASAAISVINNSSLTIGEEITAGSGRGSGRLTFDGNYEAVLEGSMFQVGGHDSDHSGELTVNVGVTITNYTNRSKMHPGVIEVLESGSFTLDGGTITGCVSPFAGAIYNRGSVTMKDGTITNNYGAMPRYGFNLSSGGKHPDYDQSYWGQPKYYMGPGAVYSTGVFTMKGGVVSGNRGEYGALVCAGSGTMTLESGVIRNNVAWSENGAGSEYDLSRQNYVEGKFPSNDKTLDPDEYSDSENPGCGGGLYAVGGSLTVGSDFSITGNIAQYNGGGLAAALGTGPRKTITGYREVGGDAVVTVADSTGTSVTVPAVVPSYSSATVSPAAASVTVEPWATITGNEAVGGNGGGVWVQDSGGRDGRDVDKFRTVNLAEDVILLNNKAGNGGGGVAAELGGKINYSCAISGNEARIGGGVYVTNIGMVTANGDGADLTGNTAAEAGGGAYIDIGDPDIHQSVYANNAGILSFRGGQVSANRVSAADGQGIGVYCDGLLALTGTAYVNHGDTIHLARNAELAIYTYWQGWSAAVDAPVRNTRGDPVTLTSEVVEEGTPIAKVYKTRDSYPSYAETVQLLAEGCLYHQMRPLAVKKGSDAGEIEINYVSITYYDRVAAEGPLDVHTTYKPFTSGETAVVEAFTVSEEFTAPQGMSFAYWAKCKVEDDGQGGLTMTYLDADNQEVELAAAERFPAGITLPRFNDNLCLVAVFSPISYNVVVNVDGETGAAGPQGELAFTGVTTDMYGYMTVGNNTNIGITARPIRSGNNQSLLQSLEVYEADSYEGYKTARSGLAMAQEPEGWCITSHAGEIYTYQYLLETEKHAEDYIKLNYDFWTLTSTVEVDGDCGQILSVDNTSAEPDGSQGTTTMDSATAVTFKTQPKAVFIHATFKWGNVRLDVAGDETPYYYDDVDQALRGAAEKNAGTAGITLLRSNSGQAKTVSFYAALPAAAKAETLTRDVTLDLNGFTLDMGNMTGLSTGGKTLRVKGGVISTGETLTDALISAPSGLVSMGGVKLQVPGEGGYTLAVDHTATVELDPDCALGRVLLPGAILIPRVRIIGAYDVSTATGNMATLCLDTWGYATAERQLVDMNTMNATNSIYIRAALKLADVGADGVDDAARWFLGTSGWLHRKAAALIPDAAMKDKGTGVNQLEKVWEYTAGPETVTRGGTEYTFYRWYGRGYGVDAGAAEHSHSAQLQDAYGDILQLNGVNSGSVAFYLSMVREGSEERYITEPGRPLVNGVARIVGGDDFRQPNLAATAAQSGDLEHDEYYTQTAIWTGSGQYAPVYAEYWLYTEPSPLPPIASEAVTPGSVSGSLALTVNKKPLNDPSVIISAVPTNSVEYIGERGAADGYTSVPGSAIITDTATGEQLYRGLDTDRYFRALTTDPAEAENAGEELTYNNTDGTTTVYYYKKGGDGYYTDNGAGAKTGADRASAKALNGADAGVYSVELVALDRAGANYAGESGWKGRIFAITPYTGQLEVHGINHVLVAEPEGKPSTYYAEKLLSKLLVKNGSDYDFAIQVHDGFGNPLTVNDLTFSFEGVSANATVDANGWPNGEGLYDLTLRPYYQTVTERLAGWPDGYTAGLRPHETPNYSDLAVGYLTVLVTNTPLTVVVAPQTVEVPYTGRIYSGIDVKRYDKNNTAENAAEEGQYNAFRVMVDEENGYVFSQSLAGFDQETQETILAADEALKKSGGSRLIDPGDSTMTCVQQLLGPDNYRMEIGSAKNLPKNAGQYTMAVRDVSDKYVGVSTLLIAESYLKTLTVTPGSMVYTGRVLNPTYTVMDINGNLLAYNMDYTLTLSKGGSTDVELLGAGEYLYTAAGINNYTNDDDYYGSCSQVVTVVPKQLDNSDVEGMAEPGYTGPLAQNVVRVEMTDTAMVGHVDLGLALYYNGRTLVQGTDYTVGYYNEDGDPVNIQAQNFGRYLVKITGQGNFQGTLVRELKLFQENRILVTNAESYTYSAANFGEYNWAADAEAAVMVDADTKVTLDLSRCDINIYATSDLEFAHPLYEPPIPDTTDRSRLQVLDAGTYLVKVTPREEYAQSLAAGELKDMGIDLSPDAFYGTAVMRIHRRTIKITPDYMQKTYGEADPQFLYITNLVDQDDGAKVDARDLNQPGQNGTGVYKVDKSLVTGALSRAAGENAGSFYQYSLGTLAVERDNYIFELDDISMFTIVPKSLAAVPSPGPDPFEVTYTAQLPYTGYAINPVSGVVYHAAIGDLTLTEGRDYTVGYDVWRGDHYTEGGEDKIYTPDTGHGVWEPLPSTPADVGWYRLTINGSGTLVKPNNYNNSRPVIFQITESRAVMTLTVTGSSTVTYKGAAYSPVVEVTNEGFAIASANYILTYSFVPYNSGTATEARSFSSGSTKFTEAGTYTIFLTGRGNFVGSTGQTTFTILPKSLAAGDEAGETPEVTMTLVDAAGAIFNANPHTPGLQAKYGNLTLEAGTDYTLSYSNHVNAGTATVFVTGLGNYTGSRAITFDIGKMQVWVKVEGAEKPYGANDPILTYKLYTDEECTQELKYQGALVAATGSVSWNAGTEQGVGQYDLALGSLSAGGNYALTLEPGQKFVIRPKPIAAAGGQALTEYMSADIPGYVAFRADMTVGGLLSDAPLSYWSPALGEKKTLTAGTDYTVEVYLMEGGAATGSALPPSQAIQTTGSYQVTYKAKGNYEGEYSAVVKVVDADAQLKLEASATALTYRWDGNDVTITAKAGDMEMTGCQFTATASTFNGKTVTFEPVNAAGSTANYHLTEAGVYTVEATVTKDGKTYFGVTTVMVSPKSIRPADNTPAGENTVLVASDYYSKTYEYTGEAVVFGDDDPLLYYGSATKKIYPARDGVVNYVVTYTNNVNPTQAGQTATATITGVGNYTGSAPLTFTIGEVRRGVSYDLNGATGADAPEDGNLYYERDTVIAQTMPAGAVRTYGTDNAHKAVFIGWSTSAIGSLVTASGQVPDDLTPAGGGVTMGDEPLVLHAVWAADDNGNDVADYQEGRFHILYKAGLAGTTGGVPVDNSYYLPGAATTVAQNDQALAYEGFTLYGWTRSAPGPSGHVLDHADRFSTFVMSNTLYASGATINIGAEDLTLYAVWVLDENGDGVADWLQKGALVRYVYYANGAAGTPPKSGTTAKDDAGAVTVASLADKGGLTRTGATFLGWSSSAAGLVDRRTTETDYGGNVTYQYWAGANEVRLYGAGTAYQTTLPAEFDVDSDVLALYAVWAADANANGTPDYEESRRTVRYHNAASAVTADMPGQETWLNGLFAPMPSLSGVCGETGVSVYFWTTDETAAKEVYDSHTKTIPADITRYAPGDEVKITADLTLYPIWATQEFMGGYVTVTASVVTEGGTLACGADAGKTRIDRTVPKSGDTALEYTITPAAGYSFSAAYRNGVDVTTDTTNNTLTPLANGVYKLTVKNLSADAGILVSFRVNGLVMATSVAGVTYTGGSFDDLLDAGTVRVTVADERDENRTPVEETDYRLTINRFSVAQSREDPLPVGSYNIRVTGMEGGYYQNAFATVPFSVFAKSIEEGDTAGAGEVSITMDKEEKDYTGRTNEPTIALKYNDKTLVRRTDYTIQYTKGGAVYAAPLDVGEYTVTITGIGNFTGTVTKGFKVTEGSLYTVVYDANGATGDVPEDSGKYLASAKIAALGKNTLERKDAGNKDALFLGWTTVKQTDILTAAPDASLVIYSQGSLIEDIDQLVAADSRELTLYALWGADDNANGVPDYDEKFTILATAVGEGGGVKINGETQFSGQSSMEVDYGTEDLAVSFQAEEGWLLDQVDVDGEDAAACGEYTLSDTAVTFKKINMNHTVAVTFKKAAGTAKPVSVTYDREKKFADHGLSLTYVDQDGQSRTVDSTYTVQVLSGGTDKTNAVLDAGSYELVIKKGSLTVTTTLTVEPKALTDGMVEAIPAASYTGEVITPAVTVKDGGATLTAADYTATCVREVKNAGTYIVTVTGVGNYTGTVTVSMTVAPRTIYVAPEAGQKKTYGVADPALTWKRYTSAECTTQATLAAGDAVTGALGRAGGENAGEYAYTLGTLTAGSNYDLRLVDGQKFTVEKRSIADALTANTAVELAGLKEVDGKHVLTVPYTGAAIAPNLILTYKPAGRNAVGLVLGTDYTASYAQEGQEVTPVEAGEYDVTVTGAGNYKDSFNFTLKVTADSSVLGVSLAQNVVTYSTQDWMDSLISGLSVKLGSDEVDENDYDVAVYDEGNSKVTALTDAGLYRVVVTASDPNLTGTGEAYFYIQPKDISAADVTAGAIADQDYTGAELKPNATLSYKYDANEEAAALGIADFDAEYSANVDAGTATVTFVGKGNYIGVCTQSFTIKPRTLTAADVTITAEDATYDSLRHLQTVTVKLGEETLAEGTDFTVSYSDDVISAGTVKVTVAFLGNYAGTLTEAASYAIQPKTLAAGNTAGGVIAIAIPDLTFTGREQTPDPSVIYTHAATGLPFRLVEDADYTVGYYTDEACTQAATVKAVGTYYAKLAASASNPNYTGERVVSFAVKAAGSGALTVSVDGAGAVYTGSPVTLAADKITVKDGAGNVLSAGEYELSYLSNTAAGTATVRAVGKAGGTYAGYSGMGSFAIAPKSIGDAAVTVSVQTSAAYTGSAVEPAVTLSYNGTLERRRDYTIQYAQGGVSCGAPVGAGEYTVTITGRGNFTGTVVKTFTVTETRLSVSYDANGATSGTAPAGREKAYFPGDLVAVLGAALTRDQASFLGWSTTKYTELLWTDEEIGAVTLYQPGETYTIQADTTFYAVWAGQTFTITASAVGGGGSVSPAGARRVRYNGSQTFTFTPDEGFALSTVEVDGVSVTVTGDSYTFENVTADHTLAVSFRAAAASSDTYTVAYAGKTLAQYRAPGGGLELKYTPEGGSQQAVDDTFTVTLRTSTGQSVAESAVLAAGTYAMTIRKGSMTVETILTVTRRSLESNGAVGDIADAPTYTGQPRTVTAVVTDTDLGALTAGTHYAVSYRDNTAAGTATLTVTGVGSYTGTLAKTFTIAPKSIADAAQVELNVVRASKSYTGAALAPEFTLTYNGMTLAVGRDYTVAYVDGGGTAVAAPVAVGSYTVTISGKGNYAGERSFTFTVTADSLVTVAYHKNGATAGDAPTDAAGYLPGSPVTILSGGDLRRTKAAFLGWSAALHEAVVQTAQEAQAIELFQPGQTYTVTADTTFYAVWGEDLNEDGTPDYAGSYTVTATVIGLGGAIDPAGARSVGYGESITFTITPSSGWLLDAVVVDGQRVENVTGSYTFQNVKANHTIAVTFKRITGTAAAYEVTYAKKTLAQYRAPGGGLSLAYVDQDGQSVAVAHDDTSYTVTLKQGGTDKTNAVLDAGEYTLTIAKDALSIETTLTVAPRNLSGAQVTMAAEGEYTGQSQSVKPTAVTDLGGSLAEDTDYTVAYYREGSTAAPKGVGVYTVNLAGQGNYTGTVSRTFRIKPGTLTVTPVSGQGKTYGEADPETFAYSPVDAGLTGALGRVSGENAGEYAFTLGSLRDDSGNYTLVLADNAPKFTVRPKDISGALTDGSDVKVTGLEKEEDDYVLTVPYTGAVVDPRLMMTYASQLMNTMGLVPGEDEDFTLEYTYLGASARAGTVRPQQAGYYTVTVTGGGNYEGSFTFLMHIVEDSALLSVALDQGMVTYDGEDWAEKLVITARRGSGKVYTVDADCTFYEAAFYDAEDNLVTEMTDAGLYKVVVTATGGAGEGSAYFYIQPKDISDADVTAAGIDPQTYDGGAKAPGLTLRFGGGTLAEDDDYTLTYQNNDRVGQAQAVATGRGNFNGVRAVDFAIQARTVTAGEAAVALSSGDAVYDGQAHARSVTVEVDGETLRQNVDYTLDYDGDVIGAGRVTVTVTLRGNYAGTLTGAASYDILPKSLAEDAADGGTVAAGVAGMIYTGAALTPAPMVTYTAQSGQTYLLTPGTDYTVGYFSDEACATPAEVEVAGTYYAVLTAVPGGNYTGSRTVSFKVAAAGGGALNVTVSPSRMTYTGSAVTPTTVVVTDSAGSVLIPGVDYTLSYLGNTNAGAATVTAEGLGAYATYTGTAGFTIEPKDLAAADVALADIASAGYTGSAQAPALTLTYGGLTLVEGRDYTVSYRAAGGQSVAAPVEVGEYTVTVSGVGNFTGERTGTFSITETRFTVTYHANGGKGTVPADAKGYLSGQKATVQRGGSLSKSGAVLIGWTRTARSGVVTTKSAEDALTFLKPGASLTVTANTDLHALWAVDKNGNSTPDYRESAGGGGGGGGGGGTTTVIVEVVKPYSPKDLPWNPEMPDLITDEHFAYMTGYPDGRFGANDSITRSEVAVMFTRLILGTDQVPKGPACSFSDVAADQWYAPYIAFLEGYGVLTGYPDGTFHPEDTITRAELCTVAVRFFLREKYHGDVIFTDVASGHWAFEMVYKAYELGLVNGYPDGSFGPDYAVNRAESVTIINRILGRGADIDYEHAHRGELKRFTDLEPTYWAYMNIVEATNGHDYIWNEKGTETWTSHRP